MKIDLSKINWEGQWFDFKDEARLKIRPIPRSRQNFLLTQQGMRFDGSQRMEDFKFSLVAIEGIEIIDQKGNAVQLNDLVKQTIFDSNWEGIPDFVLEKQLFLAAQMAESEKN